MGTTVSVAAPQGDPFDAVAEEIEGIFDSCDRRFSRFRADSELSAVNAAAGSTIPVSGPFGAVLRLALDAAAETGGLFDPTILPALVAAGYDRDFAELIDRGSSRRPEARPGGEGTWRDVRLDGGTVSMPAGLALDFGGIAKGWTVDRAAEAAAGLPWAVVDAGGDVRVTGRHPARTFAVAVEDPHERGHELLRLEIDHGALATSSVLSRRWGQDLHQLIDPRTGRPSDTAVVQATVWAPTCAGAEVRSTWALLAGPDVLNELPAVLVMDDGRVQLNVEPRRTVVTA